MSWQKRARFAIAIFVVIFVTIVVVALRHRKAPSVAVAVPERRDKDCILENTSGGHFESSKDGKIVFAMKFGAQCSYQDGRSKLGNGVEITFTRNGKPYTVTSREADITQSGDDLKTSTLRRVGEADERRDRGHDRGRHLRSAGRHAEDSGSGRLQAWPHAGDRRRRDLRLQPRGACGCRPSHTSRSQPTTRDRGPSTPPPKPSAWRGRSTI